jgi:hypothetical protein
MIKLTEDGKQAIKHLFIAVLIYEVVVLIIWGISTL